MKGIKGYINDVINTLSWGLSSEEPVIHQSIIDILNDDELREEYLDRVNNSKEGFVDVSDIIDKLDKNKNRP